jgi:putative two-component system response regulator
MGSIHTSRLETLLQSTKTLADPEIKLELTRLAASIKERLTRGSALSFDFFSSALATLSKFRGTAYADLRMKCIFDCMHFFTIGGYARPALEASRQLDSLARQSNDKRWLRKALSIGAIVYADAGNIPDALLRYAEALAIAQEIHDSEGEVIVLINLGVALMYGGLHREALPCIQRAASVAQTFPELRKHVATALTNVAQIHFYCDEYGLGLKAIADALADVEEPRNADDALHRTVREFTYVQLALGAHKLDLALDRCKLCERYSLWSGSPRSHLLTSVARGLCEVHAGDVSKGLTLLESALSSNEETGSARFTALTAIVRGCDEAGRPEEALHYLKQLLHHVRTTREQSVLALMALPYDTGLSTESTPSYSALQALERRELKLRAVVAEREVVSSRIEMLERLAVTADLKEEASGEHGYRVGKLASLLAEELNWSPDACASIELAARLHDIGKIAVPDRILLTSQELKEAERHFMSTHTVIGAELLSKSNIPQLRMAEEIARYHHECWDGTGYPSKLAGKRIPLHARIVALADVFDALTHGRAYAEPWSLDRAIEEIKSLRGTQFDPELTDAFLALVERLRIEHEDLDAFLGRAGRNSPFLQARNKIRLMLAKEQENERTGTVVGNGTRH